MAFGREDYEHSRFRKQGEKTVAARVKLTVRQTLFSLGVSMITALGTALVLGFGAYRALEGRLSPGQLLVVMSYIAMIYHPLETISHTIGSFQEIFVSLRITFDLLDKELEITDAPDAVTMGRSRGNISFQGVHFNYQGRVDTLREISFQTQPGQVVAIVGPTGAGKSTLVSLIPRFYDVVKGRVLMDGIDIRKLTLKSLREQISIVLQEPLLFSGTITENIRYGRLEASMDEIMEAARAANAHDFIMGLPKQYDTELGERGAKLSGGERQRIAVARAFLKNAPVLILDEPTSSIDSKTEVVILDALDRLMVGRTTFMIAHRLSTIRRADQILVIDQGRLVEQGSHQELLRRGGLYKQLYDMQTKQVGRKLLQDLEAIPEGMPEAPA
jgi:ATP-binding cassette, subfamily B, bacterial